MPDTTEKALVCDRCGSATERSERGWRAYVAARVSGVASLQVLCPRCAEVVAGEDEAAWWE